MKFRVKYAPQASPVQLGQLLTFEEECDLLEVWGQQARDQHKQRAAGARYVETEEGMILEVVREPGDPVWV
jgi:hypothetical protein